MRLLQWLFITGGFIFLALAAGFYLQDPLATGLWPWPDSRLSYIFLASIAAAIAAPMIWIGLSAEFAAVRAGAINLAVIAAGSAVFLFLLYQARGDARFLVYATVFLVFIILNIGLYLWSRRIPFSSEQEIPGPVRFSFGVFTAILIVIGGGLILGRPNIFPWPLQPESSVMFGIIFLGAAVYFLYALLIPNWYNAKGQLVGFLAYDLVLIGPFLNRFSTVEPDHRLSLIIYTGVLLYSGGLAVYYLFFAPETRDWRIMTQPS